MTAYNGLIISGGNFIPFHTRNAQAHTLSAPIRTQARFNCSDSRAPFVLVSITFVGSGPSAETAVFEQFVMTH